MLTTVQLNCLGLSFYSPLFLFFLTAILIIWKYPITEEMHSKIRNELNNSKTKEFLKLNKDLIIVNKYNSIIKAYFMSNTISNNTLHLYTLGSGAVGVKNLLFGSWLLVYFNQILGLEPLIGIICSCYCSSI